MVGQTYLDAAVKEYVISEIIILSNFGIGFAHANQLCRIFFHVGLRYSSTSRVYVG